ncbi:hypothetical protein ACFC34_37990 [Streptomyces sp. NPDC056053]|uniref:hypothetical protein n=1 Tax=Streptomyces sp. NPDC056053 TaxID=3345696 RepID=UPI0035E1009C
MPFYEEPNHAPLYADDLSVEDISPMRAFLQQQQVENLQREHLPGSTAARAARALEMSVGAQIDELGLWFNDDEPETFTNRLRAWNVLVFSLWPWEGHAEFDAQRWRLIQHRDVEGDLRAARHRVRALEARAEKHRAELTDH